MTEGGTRSQAARSAWIVLAMLVVVPLAAQPAAAHDKDCGLAVHIGPVEEHHDCDPDATPTRSCWLHFRFLTIRADIGCR